MLRALAFVEDRPWAMTSEAYDKLREIAAREHEFDREAMVAKLGKPLKNTYSVSIRDGVGILPVQGALFKRGNLFTEISGATSLEMLMRDFGEMQTNADVSAIVLDVDSPGGELGGVNEFAKFITEHRGKKPIVAYVGGMSASGAYWLSTAADEIVADETAILGSLGVVATFLDSRERDERSGTKTHEIVSSQSPMKRADVATEEGKASVQALVDRLADEFISVVAKNRNTTVEKVLADFGKGGVMTARDAVAVGMADRLGSLEGVIAALQSQRKTRVASFGVQSAANIPNKGARMDQEKIAADPKPVETQVDVKAITEKAREEGKQEGMIEGRTSERQRISAILGADAAAGREILARTLATDTDLTPEAAAKVLAAAPKSEPKATANSEFAQHMARVKNPEVGTDASTGPEPDSIDAEVERILKAGN